MPENTPAQRNPLLEQGIAAGKAGELERARVALIAALKVDPQSEQGWLWLASVLTDADERRACLRRVLAINPDHAGARDGLQWLDDHFPKSKPGTAVTRSGRTPPPASDLFRVLDLEPLTEEPAEDDELSDWTSALAEAPPAAPAWQPATIVETPPIQMDWEEATVAAAPAPPPPMPLVASRPQRVKTHAAACQWCGSPISSFDVHCPNCKRPLEFECPNCDYGIALEETTCSHCGWVAGDFQQRGAYLRNLGEAYLANDLYRKALPIFRHLVEVEPDVAAHHLRLSQLYNRMGQTNESLAEADRALQLEPENPDALDRLGRWYATSGDFEKLEAFVARLNALKNLSPQLTLLLGDLEFERRQYPAAFRAYRKAVVKPEFDPPTLARLYYRLGEMYLVAEDSLEALFAFKDSVATGADTHEVEQSRRRIAQIRPPLPPGASRSASETLRAMAGPILLVWMTGLVQVGLNLSQLNVPAIIGLFAAIPGSYLVASAVSTPQAIEWRSLLGPKGLEQRMSGALVALLGGFILATSIVLILFGL